MKLKKITSVLLSCILVLSLPITVYAADKKLSSDMSLEPFRLTCSKSATD